MKMPLPGPSLRGRQNNQDQPKEENVDEFGNERPETFIQDDPRKYYLDIMDSKPMVIMFTCLTIFSLWGDDVRLIVFYKEADPVFYALFLLAMCVFLTEFLTNSVAKEGYKGGFFFWLDMVATFSLLLDVKWILDLIETMILYSS